MHALSQRQAGRQAQGGKGWDCTEKENEKKKKETGQGGRRRAGRKTETETETSIKRSEAVVVGGLIRIRIGGRLGNG
jgi:hypothetical protein